jgi:hypothetical protein
MFAPLFLPLTTQDGSVIYVNADHIVTIYRSPNRNLTSISCTNDRPDECLRVVELPSTILEMIQEATDFPNN